MYLHARNISRCKPYVNKLKQLILERRKHNALAIFTVVVCVTYLGPGHRQQGGRKRVTRTPFPCHFWVETMRICQSTAVVVSKLGGGHQYTLGMQLTLSCIFFDVTTELFASEPREYYVSSCILRAH
jgi:hypothetical protein